MLQPEQVYSLIDHAIACHFDYAEFFFDRQYTIKSTLINGKISSLRSGADSGIGVRLFKNKKVFYFSTNQGSYEGIINTITLLSEFSESKVIHKPLVSKYSSVDMPVNLEIIPTLCKDEMIACMHDSMALSQMRNNLIESAKIIGTQKVQYVGIYNSEGIKATDTRHYTRISCEVMSKHLGCLAKGTDSFGFLSPWQSNMSDSMNRIVCQAAEQSRINLGAQPIQCGHYPVVLGSGSGAVIFHEACGHLLESAALINNSSQLKDKINTKISFEKLNLVDESNLESAWGSSSIDDEGKTTQKNYLIKEGVLNSFLIDKLGSLYTGYPCTGSARRESYRHSPEARMTNTYIECGSDAFNDIVGSIEDGVYAKKVGVGFVDPVTSEFQFSVVEGYRIKHGKILHPIKGACIGSNTINMLDNLSMIGSDFDRQCGMCSSYSGIVPTTVGQPTIKIDDMKVTILP